MSVRMRECTRLRVLFTISHILYTFTKLHDRRIPNVGVGVRVGVGPVEFQLDDDRRLLIALDVQLCVARGGQLGVRHRRQLRTAVRGDVTVVVTTNKHQVSLSLDQSSGTDCRLHPCSILVTSSRGCR